MASYIVYRSQRLTSLHLDFSPDAEFRTIVDEVSSIQWPPLPLNPELVSFALLELISNSIRAHRERSVTEPVRLELELCGRELRATVIDSGRGFDPARLPYDLGAKVEAVDIMSDAFAEYRKIHDGKRFGMGLYVARKTFSSFSLSFVDAGGQACPWYSGKAKGTRIDLGIGVADDEGVEELEALDGEAALDASGEA